MLAYVFWHVRRGGVITADPEARLLAFQEDLPPDAPAGFSGAAVHALSSAPWLPSDTIDTGYEDWYFLAGSADLDVLNDAAVTGHRKASHDEAARGAAWGA